VSNAALALLRHAATTRPVLLILDDVQWLDRASAVVLGLVARRLAGSRVGLLAASRSGEKSFLERGGLPEHELKRLDHASATLLLQDRFPALAPRARERLLAEAQGNPLALLELPVALPVLQRNASGTLPTFLPLSRRLQALFAQRLGNLPPATRYLLLLAVLDGTGDLGVLGGAVGRRGIEDLAPAERTRLVYVDGRAGRLTFRHPLTTSALFELSTSDERRRAHEVLAGLMMDQPERRAWHLAEAALGPDEEVATLLQRAAHLTLRRGDAVGAIAALLRAADLSPAGSDRSRRLAMAAYLGADVTGDLRSVPRLLEEARRADPGAGSLAAAVAASAHLLNGDGDIDTAHHLLVGAIQLMPGPYDAHDGILMDALFTLLLVCFFGGRSELWEPFDAALARVTPRPPETLAVLSGTFSDPARTAAPVLDRLDALVAGLRGETDPVAIVRIGIAAAFVDRLPGCREALWRVVRDGRRGGAITSAIDALFLLGNDGLLAGEWDTVARVCEEGLSLCDTHQYRMLMWPGLFLQAMVAAARGDDSQVNTLTDEMTRWAAPRRVESVRAYAAHAKTLSALGRGDYENAYQHASAVSPPGILASHVPQALWLVMDLTEAAVRSGRAAEAAAHAAAAHEAGIAAISPRLALITAGSAAIAALGRQGSELFERALAVPGTDRWPFDLARIQLAYGERLRRLKVTASAREQFTAALETFQRLGARPWAARAVNELRATGLPVGQADAPTLTPQQREIAMLAASGLSNKQIAERLFLSPRTVATHLYQLFPKLGVTSRAALRDALAAQRIVPTNEDEPSQN
jgi:DNA-binding CsgD family transcriptional regulator